jgi:serine/threonine protein kinase
MNEGGSTGGKYDIAGQVAQGGMGAILSARDKAIGRTVAMKVLLDGAKADPNDQLRFQREAQILGQLEHPNIVPMHELGTDQQGQPYYTMKFVQGRNLKDVLKAIKDGDAETLQQYSLSQLLTVFQKVCDAIAYAHSKGVIHRDLKPENIMLGQFGEVLVMDWGLAKVLGEKAEGGKRKAENEPAAGSETGAPDGGVQAEAPDLTLDGHVMGTPQFMAPEQAEGRVADMDERTDIFALGGLLYNVLSLRSPTGGRTTREILENIRSGYIAPPIIYNKAKQRSASGAELGTPIELRHCPSGQVPEALSKVAMRAMALDPAERYQAVAELQAEIGKYQGGFATEAEGAGVIRQLVLFTKRNRALAMASAIVLILLGFFLAFVVSSNRRMSLKIKELNATAPTFYAQARSLADQGEFDQAIVTVGSAIALVRDEAQYRVLRANLCQTTFKFAEAIKEYEVAAKLLPNDLVIRHNLELTRRQAAVNLGNPTNLNEIAFVLQTNAQIQGRMAEALSLSRRVTKRERDMLARSTSLLASWRAQLKAGGIPDQQIETLSLNPDGTATLNLDNSSVTNLSCLAGIPLSSLSAYVTGISSLEPLRGMPLTFLSVGSTKVDDLRPLTGMPLKHLIVHMTRVNDLAPLKGMPLETLYLEGLSIRDYSPLAGMPLDLLKTGNSDTVMPAGLLDAVGAMPLKAMLHLSSYNNLVDISFLKNKPLRSGLILNGSPISDLSALEGKTMAHLELRGTKVKDLTPLRTVKADLLNLSETPITDISPLAGTPVKELILQRCSNLRDVSPLAQCPELERLCVPLGVQGLDGLRNHTKLQKLTYSLDDLNWSKVPPIEDFWKAYDARKQKKKK